MKTSTTGQVFHTITSQDWKREIKRAKETPNVIAQRIRQLLKKNP